MNPVCALHDRAPYIDVAARFAARPSKSFGVFSNRESEVPMDKDENPKEPTKEPERVGERVQYKKPKLTKQGDLKEITALSFDPPGN